eukprot:CAMPEP_0119557686 /NCGR_PEP_ID=MMETSP1352-20130426/9274_1 /TAXON_ID=265584 /ORGANISM="Stauroneis constricta, Strain CCMP1120" /LENGTH=507 /DNA_ID=CAMNT_0007604825 /DNA_START=324 /DNA_END=1845 /DNA_ORIENTATION=-
MDSDDDDDDGSIRFWNKPTTNWSWKKLMLCFFPQQQKRDQSTFGTELRTVLRSSSSFDTRTSCCTTHGDYLDTEDDCGSRSTASDDSYSSCSDLSYFDDCDDDYGHERIVQAAYQMAPPSQKHKYTAAAYDDDDDYHHHNHHQYEQQPLPQPQQRVRSSSNYCSTDRILTGTTPTTATAEQESPSKQQTSTANRRRSFDCHHISMQSGEGVTMSSPRHQNNNNPKRQSISTEYSRTSCTSTISRHQRISQYNFSIRSMEKIYSNNNNNNNEPPPLLVLCDHQRKTTTNNEQINKPRKSNKDNQLMLKPIRRSSVRQHDHEHEQPKNDTPVTTTTTEFIPEYMRKNSILDNSNENNIILSGWIATGTNLYQKLKYDRRKVSYQDIQYLRVTSEKFQFYDSNLQLHHELIPLGNWKCEIHDISQQIGQCVVITQDDGSIITTLLPVSLVDCFFHNEKLVSQQRFHQIRHLLFPQKAMMMERPYAPHEQYDTVVYIDSYWIASCVSGIDL